MTDEGHALRTWESDCQHRSEYGIVFMSRCTKSGFGPFTIAVPAFLRAFRAFRHVSVFSSCETRRCSRLRNGRDGIRFLYRSLCPEKRAI